MASEEQHRLRRTGPPPPPPPASRAASAQSPPLVNRRRSGEEEGEGGEALVVVVVVGPSSPSPGGRRFPPAFARDIAPLDPSGPLDTFTSQRRSDTSSVDVSMRSMRYRRSSLCTAGWDVSVACLSRSAFIRNVVPSSPPLRSPSLEAFNEGGWIRWVSSKCTLSGHTTEWNRG